MAEEVQGKRVRVRWGLPVALGVLLTILGFWAVGATMAVGLATTLWLGVVLVVAGVAEIVHAIRSDALARRPLFLLGGILSVALGIALVLRPVGGLSTLTLLLAGYFVIAGLFRALSALLFRYAAWGWDFFYGLVSLALGVYVVATWPLSALWLVGLLVGIEIITRGALLIAVGLSLRRVRALARA